MIYRYAECIIDPPRKNFLSHMIRNQSGLTDPNRIKNTLWLWAFVWHTRIVKGKRPSFPVKLARLTGIGSVLFQLGRVLPYPPTAHTAVNVATDNFPKIIWMYWHDGEHAAPQLVRYCIDSWRKNNPDWDVRVLDSSNAGVYADIAYVPAGTRLQLVADALRLELLERYGGVWADVTCLCTGPLVDWLPERLNRGFFAFERPGPDRQLGNWFLASRPGSSLVATWADASRRYWRNGFYSNHIGISGRQNQFVYHYLFDWMINANPQLRSEWLAVPRLPAGPPHLLQEQLRRAGQPTHPACLRVISDIISRPDVRVHKLDWRLNNTMGTLEALTRCSDQD